MSAPDGPRIGTIVDLGVRVGGVSGVPLLVARVPMLERTAWREGRRAARAVERRVEAAFVRAVARLVRADDAIAHDRGTDVFVAALVAPARAGEGEGIAPLDARSALARVVTAVETLTGLDVEGGWTRLDAALSLPSTIERALERGAQERERYAFFSAVGHELRTPLSSIRGYLETLLDDELDAATRRRFVAIAHGEALRLGRLLDGMFEISLLDLAAVGSGRAVARLDAVLAAVRNASASSARRRGVDVRVAEIASCELAIDPDRLTLVLVNLVENAIKHGRARGTVEIAVASIDRMVTIVVDDDGPGVPADERERVFAFGARGATEAAGHGIGLAFSRAVLERAGGRIELGDAPLGGARFSVTVPATGSASLAL